MSDRIHESDQNSIRYQDRDSDGVSNRSVNRSTKGDIIYSDDIPNRTPLDKQEDQTTKAEASKCCPHCGELYQRYSSPTKQMAIKYGCPVITCPRCKGTFLDKDIEEPAFYEKHKTVNGLSVILDIVKIMLINIFPFGGAGIFFSILAIIYKEFSPMIFAIPAFVLYAYILYVFIKDSDKIKPLKDYNDSKKRLSNKHYVILLIILGYQVPESFLRKKHPDLIKKEQWSSKSGVKLCGFR